MTTRSVVRNEDQFCIYRAVESQGTRVLWELTSACNLKCEFCLVEIKRRHLSIVDALAIADDLVAMGVEKVLLSGGEPLLYPQIEQVMRLLADGGVLVKLLTNGTIEHPPVFDLIRASPTMEVSLSVPTADPAEADRIFGGRDTLRKIAATAALLPKERLNVICAISTLNIAGIEDVIDWVAERNVPCVSLTDIFKDPASGARFRADCRDLRIDAEQRRQLFRLVDRKRAQYRGRLAIRTTQFAVTAHEQCLAGRTVFYIDPMGSTWPCTVTDNRVWRDGGRPVRVRDAIAFYREAIAGTPPSSCATRLATRSAALPS